MHLNDFTPEERRKDVRVELSLPGRYMLRDRHEYPCTTIDISPTSVALRGIEQGLIGERIVAYISQLGRIEGRIARHFGKCFAFEVEAPPSKRDQLAGRIARLIQRKPLVGPENRQDVRVVPYHDGAMLQTSDGHGYPATLLDVSTRGAALNVDVAPPIDTPVMLGKTPARVVRHFQGGVALAFDEQLPEETFAEMAWLPPP